MKKTYIIPQSKVFEVRMQAYIAASDPETTQIGVETPEQQTTIDETSSGILGRENNGSNNVWSNEW